MQTVESKKNIASTLEQLAQSGRVSHCTLFYGPNLNKTFTTMIQFNNSVKQASLSVSPTETDELQEPDVDTIILNPPGSIKINLIHQLQQRIQYGSHSKKSCVVVIHNIERLTNTSANALLKTIEDPPENTIFLLSCVNKGAIMETIKSRSQSYFIAQTLAEQIDQNNQKINALSEEIDYISPQEYLGLSQFDQCQFVHKLPKGNQQIEALIKCWAFSLFGDFENISKKEQKFLEKIIEIISNMKYNLNLKLQLLAVTFKTEED